MTRILLRGGRVVDPEGGRDETGDVLVEDSLVSEIGSTPPDLSSDRRLRDMDSFQARAFDLLSAPATRRAGTCPR